MDDTENKEETVDLSRRGLKRIEKATPEEAQTVLGLVLDQNELQRLDGIDTYTRVENVSICNNFLVRMHGVSRLTHLRALALSRNGILQIEGLKDLIHLRVLKLDGNNIKSIEHLNNNIHLEHLDLSNNQISYIADISYLRSLKVLKLERNRVMDLRQCERYLPANILQLDMAHNNIQDLNEVSHLVHLVKLESFTIQGNPCVAMAHRDKLSFDYRPFILNWILSVKSIDGVGVSAIESLKAEWLYSQGRGRHFSGGNEQQAALCEYLSDTCPLPKEVPDDEETADQRKLRLILTKAQQHQQQLRDSPVLQRVQTHSPRTTSRLSRGLGRSPDRLSVGRSKVSHSLMNQSYSGETPLSTTDSSATDIMSHSFDSAGLFTGRLREKEQQPSPLLAANATCQPEVSKQVSAKPANHCLEAASKMVPVPESLMSPDYQDYELLQRAIDRPKLSSSSDTSLTDDKRPKRIGSPKLTKSATSSPKLKPRMEQRKNSLTTTKHQEVAIRKLNGVSRGSPKEQSHTNRKQLLSTEAKAAITIQRMWRGYRVRNLHRDTLTVLHCIQADRARMHILRLSCDMEATKAALDSERKIQALQMQAINALWRKVSTLQTDGRRDSRAHSDGELLAHLANSCRSLQEQVESLQSSMQAVLLAVSTSHPGSPERRRGSHHCLATPMPVPVATQTDIVAVQTPMEDRCSWLKRPQSLPLEVSTAPTPRDSSTAAGDRRVPPLRSKEPNGESQSCQPKPASHPSRIPHPTVTLDVITHSEMSHTISHPSNETNPESSQTTPRPSKLVHSEICKLAHSEMSNPPKAAHSPSHAARVTQSDAGLTSKPSHPELPHPAVSHASKIPLLSSNPFHSSGPTAHPELATPGAEPTPSIGEAVQTEQLETVEIDKSTEVEGERVSTDREITSEGRDCSIAAE